MRWRRTKTRDDADAGKRLRAWQAKTPSQCRQRKTRLHFPDAREASLEMRLPQHRQNAARPWLGRNSLRSAKGVAASPSTTASIYVEMEDLRIVPRASSREAARQAGGSLP